MLVHDGRDWLSRMLVVAGVLLLLGVVPACNCGSGGQGDECATSADCDPGLFCDPATFLCEYPDGCEDPDGDGDGFTLCDDDCDDNDPLTYPGAPEACGDGVTNDCDSNDPPDTGCMMIGTFVAPPPVGDDANDGTQASPVATINEGMAHAAMIGGGADVFVAAGTYDEAVTMVEGTSLLGGFESSGWTRDPSANITSLNPPNDEGVVIPAGVTSVTELSGFSINGATGVGGAASTVDIAPGASPVVTNNIITGPDASGPSRCIVINDGGGVNMASPRIEGNVMFLGIGGSGFPGGTTGVETPETPAEIFGNEINLLGDDIVERGITAYPAVTGLIISGNRILGPTAGISDRETGIGFSGGGAYVDGNEIVLGECFQRCTGIAINAQFDAVVTNNIVWGGVGFPSVALAIQYEDPMGLTPDILVHSNYLNGGGDTGNQYTSYGVRLDNFGNSVLVIAGRFINNIIDSGVADFRYAFSEMNAFIDPEALDSNDFWLDPSGTALMSGLYEDEGPGMVLMMGSDIAALTDTTVMSNISADPLVMDGSPGGDAHLLPGSPCIDVGSSAELPASDFDGNPRPGGSAPDIGADES